MVSFLSSKKRSRQPLARMTSVSFSADDLADLGYLIAVGRAVLQKDAPIIARLKAAMTRMGVRVPKEL